MNIVKSGFLLLTFLGLLMGSLGVSFAVEQGVCCYTPGADRDLEWQPESCSSDQIEVGPGETSADNTNPCSQLEEQERLGCRVDGVCYQTIAVDGEAHRVYDFPEVKDYLNADNYCSNYQDPIDLSTCTGTGATVGTSTGGDDDTSTGDTDDDSGDGTDFDDRFDDTGEPQEKLNLCEGAGGPYQLFTSEQTCENIQLSGDDSCLYNPYLGGKLRQDFPADLNLIKEYEQACVAYSNINECLDYKTPANCRENPAKEVGGRLLENGCEWVPAGNYADGRFADKSGVCITNGTDRDAYYDRYAFAFRKNNLHDSSFEEDLDAWSTSTGVSRVQDPLAFHGTSYLEMSDGSSISQMVYDVAPRVSYASMLAVAADEVEGVEVTVSFTPYDAEDNVISEEEQTFTTALPDLYGSVAGNFERIALQDYVTPEEAQAVNVTYSVSGGPLRLDAVLFEPHQEDELETRDIIYKPVEIPTAEASRCSACHESLNLNICTQEKTNYLGDCSYMVEGPEKPYSFDDINNYLGSKANPYDDENGTWTSQSLANSQLFCGLYQSKNQCLNPDNYVNSQFSTYHTETDTTLCQWNNAVGCFKDSTGDGKPDTIGGGAPLLWGYEDGSSTKQQYKDFSSAISGYERDPEASNNDPSDFSLECDVVPPNSYVFMRGVRVDGEAVTLKKDQTNMVGNVSMTLQASDTLLESCEPFADDMSKRLFVDYKINGNTYYETFDANQIEQADVRIKEFLKENEDDQLIKSGTNEVAVRVLDQSGNVGKVWNYTVNIDAEGPRMELLAPTNLEMEDSPGNLGVVSTGLSLTFNASDYSSVESCSYELRPTSGGVPDNYYNASGEIDVSHVGKSGEFEHDLPVHNTTISGDAYVYELTCEDMYDQNSSLSFGFVADGRTEVVLVSPDRFRAYDQDVGFLNGDTQLIAYSPEEDLASCQIQFPGGGFTGDTSATITEISDPDSVSMAGFPGLTFQQNVTATLSFSSDGEKEGTLVCEDATGNTYEEKLHYYYDTQPPTLEDTNLSTGSAPDGAEQAIIMEGGDYYTIERKNLDLEMVIDGTGSWISDWFNRSPSDVSSYSRSGRGQVELNESTFIGNLTINDFPVDPVLYEGEEQVKNLYEMSYDISFEDKAGNRQSEPFSYFYDNSTPAFSLSGDIANRRDTDLYTASADPTISVGFNTPDYRKFSCGVTVSQLDLTYQQSFDATSSLDFTLSDVSSGSLTLSPGTPIDVRLSCVDQYGVELDTTYTLHYDNTDPVLERIFLKDGSKKFFRKNTVYAPLDEELVFDLNDTGEEGYNCSFSVSAPRPSDNYYKCSTDRVDQEFTAAGLQNTEPFTLLQGTNGDGVSANPRCERRAAFDTSLASASGAFETKAVITGKCEDFSGRTTESRSTLVDIVYTDSSLVDMTFSFSQEEGLVPTVLSMQPFQSVLLSLTPDAENQVLRSLSNPQETSNGLYRYTPGNGIPVGDLPDGEFQMYGIAVDSAGTVMDRISRQVDIDTVPPSVDIRVPDMLDGNVYLEQFNVKFNASDEEGELEKLQLFIDGTKVHEVNTSNDLDHSDTTMISAIPPSLNDFSDGLSKYDGVVEVNSSYGSRHDIRVVAIDSVGFTAEANVTVNVSDGVGLILDDTSDAIVGPIGERWQTTDSAPSIAFNTTKPVGSCELLPFSDQEWVSITGDSSIDLQTESLGSGQSFTFDLAGLSRFDLQQLSDKTATVKIVCNEGGDRYAYQREVQFMEGIPDYTLTSSNGYSFIEEPYDTTLTIESAGPYARLDCEYRFDGSTNLLNGNAMQTSFTSELNFTGISSGSHELELVCKNALGMEGLQKTYTFDIDRDASLAVKSLELQTDKGSSVAGSDDEITVAAHDGVDMEVALNKQGASNCQYVVNRDSALGGVIGFVKRLFSIGVQAMDQSREDAYLFTGQGLSFPRDSNILEITCQDTDGSLFEKEYTVKVEDTAPELGVSTP